MIDALGLPVDIDITVGERYDSVPAAELLERCKPKCLLADKAYDSNALREHLAKLGSDVCIPSHPRRIVPHDYDRDLYKARTEIERTFNLLKQARRFATRYEKTLRNYTAMVLLSCILCWLRISTESRGVGSNAPANSCARRASRDERRRRCDPRSGKTGRRKTGRAIFCAASSVGSRLRAARVRGS